MRDLNIFTYEPSKENALDGYDEKENNVTRAFLNTLQFNHDYCQFLFKYIFGEKLKFNNTRFKFQVNPEDKKYTIDSKIKYFLIISPDYNINQAKTKEKIKDNYGNKISNIDIKKSKSNRPDGLIFYKNNNDEIDYAILIEAKFGSKEKPEQIKNYINEYFNIPIKPFIYHWEDIYLKSVEYLKDSQKNLDEAKYFIVNQFIKYLEIIMPTFNGIPYFIKKEDRVADKEYDLIEAKKILNVLRKEYLKFENIKIENSNRNFTGSLAWDNIYLKGYEKIDLIHYSIYLDVDSFEISLTARKQMSKAISKNKEQLLILLERLYKYSHLDFKKDYYFSIIDYKQLNWKQGAMNLPRFSPFKIQISLEKIFDDKTKAKFPFNELMDFVSLSKMNQKQIEISKIFYFNDNMYQKAQNNINDMTDSKVCLSKIKDTLVELKPIYEYFLSLKEK